jgi:adenine-specific DNA-methyltransferase
MIIKGDNLEALKALLPYYKGQVKCIYIDPPYNTGSAFEHYDDNLEHSTWLSMMYPRLELLRELLAENGSIWISIDDKEQAFLKVVMDEIFGNNNFIAVLPTIMNLKGNQDQFAFAGTHEYTVVYSKNNMKTIINLFQIDEEEILLEWEQDEVGYYKQGANLKATGINAPKDKRPNLFYPIYINGENSISLLKKQGYKEILPITDGKEMSWRWSKEKLLASLNDIIINRSSENISLYKKQRPFLGDLPTKKPKSVFYKPEYSSGNGTAHIKQLFNSKVFDYPKPEELISDFLTLATNPGDLVLDSFLGSGTTVAVAQKMGRRYIGIEMGEQAITHVVPRLKKVIDGEQGGISKSLNWQGGGGFTFYDLEEAIFDEDGAINKKIDFKSLAFHIWFSETKTALVNYKKSPLLGIFNDTAYYLLYNGILGDKKIDGGNVLTSKILETLPQCNAKDIKRVIYGEACRLSLGKLRKENIIFKQTPYDLSVK